MTEKIKIKVPTKTILIGEHSVVYGKPALVCAIDLYCYCGVKDYSGQGILLRDKKDGKKKEYLNEYSFDEILNLENDFSYKKKKDKLFKITLHETLKYLEIKSIEPFEVVIEKEAPIGGCGVSTSVIVSVAKALGRYFEKNLSEKDLFNIAMKVETRFHNYKSSGADQAAIVYGGLIRYQKKEDSYEYKKINIKSNILKKFLIINSGSPEALTGEVVEFVRQEKERDPARVDKIFNNLENLTEKLIGYLEKNNKDKFYDIIDKASEELIDLGIVTSKSQKLISDLNDLGGHAKISGAGSHKSEGSGALICFGDDRERVEQYLEDKGIEFYVVNVVD